MLNISDAEKEVDFQMMIFASLDLVEYKELQRKNKTGAEEDYIGILMPFYEHEYEIGSYGYLGNNGYKLICLKKLDNSIQETSSEIKLKEIFNDIQTKLVKIMLNPFFDKKDFITNPKSREKEILKDYLVDLFSKKQTF